MNRRDPEEDRLPVTDPVATEAEWYANMSSDAARIFEEIPVLADQSPAERRAAVDQCIERCQIRLRELHAYRGLPLFAGAKFQMVEVYEALLANITLLFGTGKNLPQGILTMPAKDRSWRSRRFGHPRARVFILENGLGAIVPKDHVTRR